MKCCPTDPHLWRETVAGKNTQGQPYVEQGIEAFEARRQARQLRALQRKAARFGLARQLSS